MPIEMTVGTLVAVVTLLFGFYKYVAGIVRDQNEKISIAQAQAKMEVESVAKELVEFKLEVTRSLAPLPTALENLRVKIEDVSTDVKALTGALLKKVNLP